VSGQATPSRPGALALLARDRLAVAALALLALVAAAAVAAPLLPLPDPDATDLSARLLPPLSSGHPLGTDQLGRDLLARVVWGTRVSLVAGLAAALAAGVIGSLIGLASGFFGRWTDAVLMRGVEVIMAFPYLLLALAIIAVLGPGLVNALIAVAVVNIPFFARAVRGTTVGLAGREFVEAARLGGLSEMRILLGEILPNVLPVIVITISTTIGWMILETAGLSFLGLGSQPPTADLGSMLGEGRKVFIPAPHVTAAPGLAIVVLVMAINVLGDGVRDVLDPRLKSGALSRPAAVTEVASGAGRAPPADRHRSADDAALRVDGLRTWFHTGDEVHRAADDVSFALAPGECLGLVGESGCGKSVTALSLLKLVPSPPGRIEDGRIAFRGEDVIGYRLARLRGLRGGDVGYVFQDPLAALDPLFTVGDQILEAMRAHRRRRDGGAGGNGNERVSRADERRRAAALLERVRLPDAHAVLGAYPHELSGGMRQRVSIAIAIANEPDVVVADEPTTALDVTTQAEILDLLGARCRDVGAALVFISHDFAVVSRICDRVLVMYAGQVVESGTVEQVLGAPAHPYTRRLLACVPRLGHGDEALDAIPGLPPSVARLPEGCYFAARCDRVVDRCRAAPVALEALPAGRAARCIRAREEMAGGGAHAGGDGGAERG